MLVTLSTFCFLTWIIDYQSSSNIKMIQINLLFLWLYLTTLILVFSTFYTNIEMNLGLKTIKLLMQSQRFLLYVPLIIFVSIFTHFIIFKNLLWMKKKTKCYFFVFQKSNADWCLSMLIDAYQCWLILINADHN